jgi:hypothetical protein
MKIRTSLPNSVIESLLLGCGMEHADKRKTGEDVPHGFVHYVGKKGRRIHVVFSSEGLDVHEDTPSHKTTKSKKLLDWHNKIKQIIQGYESKISGEKGETQPTS